MVLGMPTSASELNRHSIRASTRNPACSISRMVDPNSGDKCGPSAIILKSTSGCAARSCNGQYSAVKSARDVVTAAIFRFIAKDHSVHIQEPLHIAFESARELHGRRWNPKAAA